jgi:hypothetical protein
MRIRFRQGIVAPCTPAALDLGDPAVGYRGRACHRWCDGFT